ncbi:MAG: hypothetical protein NTY04_04490 [Candidatus Staskawiczbacteria bacterium]|nr:hypothetical protein [Candidatus Staskawiczbacteria bacterium]
MADINKKEDDLKNIPTPEKRTSPLERGAHFETEKKPETREVSPYEKMVSADLRREIEMMDLDEKTKGEAEKKAKKIEFLGEKEKIEHLLEVAREKGVVFAIQIAKKMGDSYILDILHDILSQEGLYKNMAQSDDDDKDDNKKKKN